MFSSECLQFDAQQVTIYKVQDLEVALEKAMENISELQNNLQFMIKYNDQLKHDQQNEQKKYSKTIHQLQFLLTKKDKQIALLKQKHNDYEVLFSDNKMTLEQCKQTILSKQQELERAERIIHEQKLAISQLQEQLLSSKYNQVSFQQNQSCFLQLEGMQKRIQQLEYQNKRSIAVAEKQSKRAILLEKENAQFKNWLGETVGVKKVVNGCEKVLMNEITKKIAAIR